MRLDRSHGFAHRKALHCGSGTLADVLRFGAGGEGGQDLPEEAVFGLGAGLGFSLHGGDTTLTPPQAGRFFVGRSGTFERDLCAAVGAHLDVEEWDDPEDALRAARGHLARERPVLLFTDLFHLPYLEARGHWYGHLVALVGFEDKGLAGDALALIADNEFADLQRCPVEALRSALCGPEPLRRGRVAIATVGLLRPRSTAELRAAASSAIALQASRLRGSADLRALPGELRSWEARADWQRCLRLAAQVIEVRGCGGGLFRRMYARFLGIAAKWGEGAAQFLVPGCTESAEAFSALAAGMEAARARPSPDLRACADLAARCAAAEERLWARAQELFPPPKETA
jgi:hypothetical protein